MIVGLVKKIFGTHNDRKVNQYRKRVEKINKFYEQMQLLSEEQLLAKTSEFKERLQKGETVNDILPEAFAVVKDACRRLYGTQHDVMGHSLTWNMIPYDVQLIGGMVIHDGGIAEMATGEGKTLVSTLPLYLNALTGKNCQLVTVNEYLAQRDSQWMGVLLKYLGISVGCILNSQYPALKKAQYECDVTYGTNSEFGFDYLRDMGANSKEAVVQRDHYFSIVDEIDSILIDEARTPLIISAQADKSTHKYDQLEPLIEKLYQAQNVLCTNLINDAKDVLLNDKSSSEEMEKAVYDLVRVKLGMPKHKQFLRLMEEPKFRKMLDKKEGEVRSSQQKGYLERTKETLYFAIDEQANDVGLSEMGRKFISPDDIDAFVLPDLALLLSQVDAQESDEQERLKRRQEIQEKYEERSEVIHNISQLLKAFVLFIKDVHYVVMENKIMIVDEHTGRIMDGRRYSDGLHQAIEAKERVEIERETQTIASITIQNYFRMYEKLAGMTGTAETEATEFKEIYKLDVVTIPTHKKCIRIDGHDKIYKTRREKYNAIIDEIKERNSKGQPILVGTASVDVSEVISRMLKREKITHNVLNAKNHHFEAEIVSLAGQKGAITIATNMAGRGTDIKLGEGVTELGGLHVIGSERHDSRRIDRQLRGRCSRQGDPGSTSFYVSLEDDLMRLFGSERVASIMERLGMKEGEELCSPILSRSIGGAQKKVEQNHYSMRKRVLQYDDVMNRQREVIYGFRKEVLFSEDTRKTLFEVIERSTDDSFDKFMPENPREGVLDKELYMKWLRLTLPVVFSDDVLGEGKEFNRDESLKRIVAEIDKAYILKEKLEDPDRLRWLEREIILNAIDKAYRSHLYEMDQLRNSVHLRQYAQKDPLVEYKTESYKLFMTLLDEISKEILTNIFRTSTSIEAMRQFLMNTKTIEIHEEVEQFNRPNVVETVASEQPQMSAAPYQREMPKVGRNDICPCGSGKKYKNCCENKI